MVTIPLSSTRGNILSFTITIFLNESEILRKGRFRDKFNLSVFIFFEQNEAKNAKILLFRGTRFLAFTYYK